MATKPNPCSAYQRSRIKSLLKQAEFDSRTVTLMHRRLGAPDAFVGKAVDEWLSSLDMRAASDMIEKLMDIAGVDEDEEGEDA